ALGEEAEARAAFEAVRDRLLSIDDRAKRVAMAARIEIECLSLTTDYEELKSRVEKALALEPGIEDRVTLARLAWATFSLGTTEESLGHWAAARRLFEDSVRVAERNADPSPEASSQFGWAREKLVGSWADGRSAGSRAATHLAEVLMATGDREGAEQWIERA